MALITRTYSFTDGTTAYGSQVDSEIANIVNTLNSLDAGSTTWTNVKVTTLNPQADIAMNSHKLTGLAPGTSAGDSITFDQVASVPTGAIFAYGSSSAPSGYFLCNGQAVSRTTWSGLFAVVGTTYGSGDGSTTFNVPDLRRRIVMGVGGSGTSTLGNTMGSTGGEESHTLTVSEIPANLTVTDPGHTHVVPGHDNDGSGSIRYASGLSNAAPSGAQGTASSNTTGISVGGSGASHNTLPPTMVLNYIIKA